MNKHELNAYDNALKDFNPFYGIDFPITSTKLCEIINDLREQYNEKAVTLRHDHFMEKVKEFDFRAPNFRVSESKYKTEGNNKDYKQYLLCKNSCRVLASSESKTINKLIMVYLAQLEAIFEKAKESKVTAFDNKLAKHGITWREACSVVGITHSGLALKYMIKAGHFKRSPFDGSLSVSPALIKAGQFKYVQTQGRNKEGFRVLKKGFETLEKSVENINWKCLQFSEDKRHQAQYKAILEAKQRKEVAQ